MVRGSFGKTTDFMHIRQYLKEGFLYTVAAPVMLING